MSKELPPDVLPVEVPPANAPRNYTLVCFLALVVLVPLLLRRPAVGMWTVLPVGAGFMGTVFRWRAAPLLVLILLGGILFYSGLFEEGAGQRGAVAAAASRFSLEDWLLCAAALAYCAAHYRLEGLTSSIFPDDPRRKDALRVTALRERGFDGSPLQPRKPRTVPPAEIGWLILSVPMWAFAAQVFRKLLPANIRGYGFPPAFWQGILLVWLLGIGLFATAGILSYLGRQRLSRREALLAVQDALWLETARDQRRLSRWLTWARLRRRKEDL
jgi:hypothetical protein